MTTQKMLVQAQRGADLPHLELVQILQRLHQSEMQVLGQATHVVMALDAALVGLRLGDVGPDRALRQPLRIRHLTRLVGEHIDESLADGLALQLGIGDALAGREEAVRGTHADHVESHALIMLEDILELILAQQAVVHEDADQVLADSLVYQQGRDRGIHAARKAEHDDVVSDLGLDFSDSVRDELLCIQFFSVVHICD